MKKRHLIREQALQALYAYQFSQNTVDQVLSDPMLPLPKEERDLLFLRLLVDTTARSQMELDMLIEGASKNWCLGRIAFIDRIILRLALAELLFFPDIPPKVSIDEALELAKKYSTEESCSFINGILDKLFHDLTQANKINKTGRGLVNMAKEKK